MRWLFWLSAAFVVYVYAGYPAILWLLVKLRGRRRDPVDAATTASFRPPVSIIVAARNEGRNLRGRIENLLQLDYPVSARQIIVVSDGSTDDTDSIVASYAGVVEYVAIPPGGKAVALNAGVRRARHEILVFADARQRFAADALIELTRPLLDRSVGGVTGELLLDCESAWRRTGPPDRRAAGRGESRTRRRTVESTIAAGLGAYWRYEKALRHFESALGSTLGATGAIYALRRSLWTPLPPQTILDDVLAPMRAVLAGSRVVFNRRARAFDRSTPDASAESARKVRTLVGNFQILRLEPQLLQPTRNPVWFQYLSHKVARLFVPYALLALMASSMALSNSHPLYLAATVAQSLTYLLAGYGAWIEHRAQTATQPVASSGLTGVAPMKEATNG